MRKMNVKITLLEKPPSQELMYLLNGLHGNGVITVQDQNGTVYAEKKTSITGKPDNMTTQADDGELL